MSNLNLQQLKCSSCGSNITQLVAQAGAYKGIVECPYCHSPSVILQEPKQTSNGSSSQENENAPKRIIKFTTTEDDFCKKMIEVLAKTLYVPLDIYDNLAPERVFQAYLPMYSYEGKFNTTWSCEQAYQDTKTVVRNGQSHEEKVTKYRPANGTTFGNYSFLALAYEGEDIPAELIDFSKIFDYKSENSTVFNSDELSLVNQVLVFEQNIDSKACWKKSGGDEKVNSMAEEKAMNQAGDCKNFNCSTQVDPIDNGTYLFAPFWFTYFNYKDNKYHFIMDGLGDKTSYKFPEDPEQVKKASTYTLGMILSVVVAIVVAIICHFALKENASTGYVVAAIGGIIGLIVFSVLKRKYLNECERIRTEAASRLLNTNS